MNLLPPFFSANRPCNDVLPWLEQQLSRAGMRVIQTFDLRLTSSLKPGYCTCPHHGTDQCDCQMIVLLIYGKEERPVSLIMHGNDGQTWLSLVDHPGQPAEAGTVSAIRKTLEIQSAADL